MKEAISLQKSLYKQVQLLARELKITPRKLIVLAVEGFIQRQQNQRLLERINAVYDDAPNAEEQEFQRRMKREHLRVVAEQR